MKKLKKKIFASSVVAFIPSCNCKCTWHDDDGDGQGYSDYYEVMYSNIYN